MLNFIIEWNSSKISTFASFYRHDRRGSLFALIQFNSVKQIYDNISMDVVHIIFIIKSTWINSIFSVNHDLVYFFFRFIRIIIRQEKLGERKRERILMKWIFRTHTHENNWILNVNVYSWADICLKSMSNAWHWG